MTIKALKIAESLRRVLRFLQMPRATIYGITTVGLRLLASPISAILIMTYFTPELQGYYYTFGSVLAIQIFVELGFSNIVTFFAGHEWAKLSLDTQGHITGEKNSLSRLVSLGRAAFYWYLIGGVMVAIGLGAAGYIFFSQGPVSNVSWEAPWFCLCILSGINLVLMPIWSILQGCGQVSQIYSFRMISTFLSALVTWGAIFFGAGLWTSSIVTGVLVIMSMIYLVWNYRQFFMPFFSRPSGPRISWWGEIWQVQWRTALSYLSGYFISQIFVPIIFHFHGAALAGQFGMTWSLILATASVASMWSTPRGPQFAVMIARKEYKAIDQILFRITKISFGVLLLGGICVWALVYGLNLLKHPFASRLLPTLPTALLIMGNVVANALHPTSVYLRSHKREPYVELSIVSAVIIGLSAYVFGMMYGAIGVAIAFLVMNLFLFPWGLRIFVRCRREWHSE